MGSLAGFLDYLRKRSPFFETSSVVDALQTSAGRFSDELREITGGHYPAGMPLVHLRCGCNKWVAAIETGEDGEIITYWRRRRYPGVPAVECPDHGRLVLETGVLREKVRAARRSGKPQTMKLRR